MIKIENEIEVDYELSMVYYDDGRGYDSYYMTSKCLGFKNTQVSSDPFTALMKAITVCIAMDERVD